MKTINIKKLILILLVSISSGFSSFASSHREAPLIANDPLADNTDLYAFRSPDDPNYITMIACYVPLQSPQGGPNYYNFGENIRYEVHVDNNTATTGDDIIYRFTFTKTNQDPTTFFNIRLGQQNQKLTYNLERSTNGGTSFTTVISNGIVPPNNVGDRSISSPVGLNTNYNTLFMNAITTASSGEQVFCGPSDDPFFVDLGGVFDLGDMPRQGGGTPKDGVAKMNVSVIAIKVPISTLQKTGKTAAQAANILDSDFVIGVWASASRQQMRTLNANGTSSYSGSWVQVSRIGMPLTNEAVIPIGNKDLWNSLTPYQDLANLATFGNYFYNPELALYMDNSLFGGAVPAFAQLRVQRNSLQSFDFGNGNNGLYGLKGSPAVAGTALDDAIFGTLLLPAPNSPRSVDLWPIFHTGVPNLAPYHLATGKGGNPLANGKPFINNFLPNGGDMLRLNMAVPPTPRNSPAFSKDGLLAAAVSGLTDPTYNSNTNIQFIPNMDGFPNGRRLEDDVTAIELKAVSGVVLAAIGLWYDDYTAGGANPVTPNLVSVLSYSTGVNNNDTTFRSTFPYVQLPWSGTSRAGGLVVPFTQAACLAPSTLCNTAPSFTSSIAPVGNTVTICAGSTTTLTGAAGAAWYYWYKNGTLVFNSGTTANYTVGGTTTGTDVYTLKVKYNGSSCLTPASSAISVVRQAPNAVITPSGPVSFCLGTTAPTLTASAGQGFTYSWICPTGCAAATGQTFVPVSSGSHKVVVTDAMGCVKTSAAVSVITLTPPAAYAGVDKTICMNSPSTIGVNPVSGFTYSWAPSTNLSNANIAKPTVTPSSAGTITYTLMVMNSAGCMGTDMVNVTAGTVPSTPTLASTSSSVCQGTTITLTPGSAVGPVNWYKNGVLTATASNAGAITIYTPSASPDSYTISANNGTCLSNLSNAVSVMINAAPVPTISSNPVMTGTQVILCKPGMTSGIATLMANTPSGAPSATYQWQKVTGGTTSNVGTGASYMATVSTAQNNQQFRVVTTYSNSCVKMSNNVLVKIINQNCTPNRIGADDEVVDVFTAFPNPTEGLVNINIENNRASEGKLVVYNTLGQVVLTRNVLINSGKAEETIDLSAMTTGIYTLSFQTESGQQIQKIVKE